MAYPAGNSQPSPVPATRAPSAGGVAPTPVNILLVDDEPRNLNVLEGLLQSPEHHLIRAQTAEEALLLLLEGEFAAIVLDIQMPGMNGIELANLIKQRKRTQHIPILFLTAYYQEDKDILEGYGIGAVDYLTKPVNPQILKSKVAVFADLFRKTRALAASNGALESEIAQRQKAEEALRVANNELETRVSARTAELVKVNEELRERGEALRASESKALAASRAKDDFLARLSHELRTPLNPVLLLASESASDVSLPAAVRADFELITRNISLEARLIDDLLDLTRINEGKFALGRVPVDVHAVLHFALAIVEPDLRQKEIKLGLDLRADKARVLGDDVRLKQVFWNVLSNAVKFSSPQAQIRVETGFDASREKFLVKIIDQGIGMTEGELGRVFEAFVQGDHAGQDGSHRFGGLGLGLSISRRIVELHSGTINAASAGLGRGTTFVIELPASLANAAPGPISPVPEHVAASKAACPPGQVLRILLVEDHLSTRNALTALLGRRGYDVIGAACLAEAREAMQEGRFDLLMSDIGLPDGSGYDLMGELRDRPHFAAVALTGYGMKEDVDRSLAAGFVAHLTKPVKVQDLDQALAVASQALKAARAC